MLTSLVAELSAVFSVLERCELVEAFSITVAPLHSPSPPVSDVLLSLLAILEDHRLRLQQLLQPAHLINDNLHYNNGVEESHRDDPLHQVREEWTQPHQLPTKDEYFGRPPPFNFIKPEHSFPTSGVEIATYTTYNETTSPECLEALNLSVAASPECLEAMNLSVATSPCYNPVDEGAHSRHFKHFQDAGTATSFWDQVSLDVAAAPDCFAPENSTGHVNPEGFNIDFGHDIDSTSALGDGCILDISSNVNVTVTDALNASIYFGLNRDGPDLHHDLPRIGPDSSRDPLSQQLISPDLVRHRLAPDLINDAAFQQGLAADLKRDSLSSNRLLQDVNRDALGERRDATELNRDELSQDHDMNRDAVSQHHIEAALSRDALNQHIIVSGSNRAAQNSHQMDPCQNRFVPEFHREAMIQYRPDLHCEALSQHRDAPIINHEMDHSHGDSLEVPQKMPNVFVKPNTPLGAALDLSHPNHPVILPAYDDYIAKYSENNTRVTNTAIDPLAPASIEADDPLSPITPMAQNALSKPPRPFKCNKCGKILQSKNSLRRHEAAHGEGDMICDHCGRAFHKAWMLRRHVLAHVSSNVCEFCGKRCVDERKLRRHEKIHFEAKHSCTICRKEFTREDGLKRHIDIVHHKTKLFECRYCPLSFSVKCNLEAHEKNSHLNIEEGVKCHVCSKSYKNKATFRVHMKTHGPARYRCVVCQSAFHRQPLYRRHMRNFHPKHVTAAITL